MSSFFETHRATLEKALETAKNRDYWSAYPEMPSGKIYGEAAKTDGQTAFENYRNSDFKIEEHPEENRVGDEASPYGLALNIKYPTASAETLISASKEAGKAWGKTSIEDRVGVCLEILHRLNKRSFEVANAVTHTTGQAFMMAFQAGGPHAQDRGLEAVTYAYEEMKRTPASAIWSKPAGKDTVDTMEKTWRIVPRGVALEIGCATFPTWNGYPGIFASLATGNSVIVKPHPKAILPLAISVSVARDALKEAGFDPNTILLAADTSNAQITQDLSTHSDVKIIGFTGSNAFGQWLRDNAKQADIYTEEAGVNSIVVSSTDNFRGMTGNIGFSLSLYSGQMCTAPQNIYVPKNGIETEDGHKSFDEVAEGIVKATNGLLKDPQRAAGVCGAISNDSITDRVATYADKGEVLRASTPVEGLDSARTATPLILKVDASKSHIHTEEAFGPISFIIATDDTTDAINSAAHLAATKGAITSAIYSTDDAVLDQASDAFGDAGVNLSCNLTGGIFVNQSAAFSDFHVTGANPAGNASLTDSAFVAKRFRVVATRKPVAA
ncbi:phenylacetic acid degradation protein PaaN [Curvivirga aplysinae]|uniref:phenylacetic acid degradation protein PaaN n=1 Tax=Curvivirga aplysinae TaxID=2529852 RepID=UPI0012BB822C|nr:phenylacetic acid degradation protein PaaN [Curvivirga aplysinae]MTI09865.1 phenylacetic acid degradation protein PaaN [Curvivirga aplysinae]